MEEKVIDNKIEKTNLINTEINLINKEPKKNIGGPDKYNKELITNLMINEEIEENDNRS